ncbi:DNA mismatch repair protein MutS [Bacillota bacterium LX-D]|nr:DNA mismatch repair protein MutS [Bacillota bacterium LX-D]
MSGNVTPMMRQYLKIKQNYLDSILFFRLGDFYEMFFEDALTASKELEITLTSREGGEERVPMCGIPYHAADGYIARLVNRGYKVAICEQVEDPKSAKGIVKREVIRVITPGTIVDEKVLSEKQNNYLVALAAEQDVYSLAYIDISTGEFKVTYVEEKSGMYLLIDELVRLKPAEILFSLDTKNEQLFELKINQLLNCSYHAYPLRGKEGSEILINHFGAREFSSFCFARIPAAVKAAGMIMQYLKETQKIALQHIINLNFYQVDSFMVIDLSTRNNLELTVHSRNKTKNGSLLQILDETVTAMGGRKLKQWLEQPLLDLATIQLRLDMTEELVEKYILRSEVRTHLKKVYDVERLLGKVAYGTANARDILALKNSLLILKPIKEKLQQATSPGLNKICANIELLPELVELLDAAIIDDPPIVLKEGGIIKTGYNLEVDRLREATRDGRTWIANLEQEEKERTGIKSLKVGYNKVFGYYIEVTKSNLASVPADFIRKQTLANVERYITPKLKELEELVLHAEERAAALEYELFLEIRQEVTKYTAKLQKLAQVIAELDVICSFAEIAVQNNYTKPIVDQSCTIELTEARHPVVEKLCLDTGFVPNDCYLDTKENQLAIITGPNMAGKSTYIRMIALLTIMAQIGCFIPAKKAKIGIVDRVFARIGASDDLARGQSTFMVEMNEVANILTKASKQSLIILDEVGRGTSTLDGLSIAWAINEYILDKLKARTLFATHYHELISLADSYSGVKNYSMAVKEYDDTVIFLRQVVPGGSDRSYGIHVAKLAGVPQEIIARAQEKLLEFEKENYIGEFLEEAAPTVEKKYIKEQNVYQEIVAAIKNLDVNYLTPLDALNFLNAIKNKLKKCEMEE